MWWKQASYVLETHTLCVNKNVPEKPGSSTHKNIVIGYIRKLIFAASQESPKTCRETEKTGWFNKSKNNIGMCLGMVTGLPADL